MTLLVRWGWMRRVPLGVETVMVQEQRLADKDQHIIAIGAARRHQLAQGLGGIESVLGAVRAVQERFVRGKAAQREGLNGSALGFVNLERRLTVGAIGLGGPKGHGWRLGEQGRRGTLAHQLLLVAAQGGQRVQLGVGARKRDAATKGRLSRFH